MYPFHLLRMRQHDDTRARLITSDEGMPTADSQRHMEAWLRGFISFTDLCKLEGWDAAERKATLEGLGVSVPEWIERAKLLAWTEEAPTESGYYWLRIPEREGSPLMVYVSTITLKASVRVFTGSWMDMPEGCLWAGPLPMPMLPGASAPAPAEGHPEGTQWHGQPSATAKIEHMARFEEERVD